MKPGDKRTIYVKYEANRKNDLRGVCHAMLTRKQQVTD